MFIQTEETPNPNTLKFIPGVQVLKEGTVEFKDNVSARSSNLASLIFSINGVERVFLATEFVSVTKINEDQIVVLDTREKTEYKKGHISQAILHDASTTKKIDFNEVVVYDKDEMTSVSSAEKISKINSIKVFYLEGGIQSWTENNLPLVEGK